MIGSDYQCSEKKLCDLFENLEKNKDSKYQLITDPTLIKKIEESFFIWQQFSLKLSGGKYVILESKTVLPRKMTENSYHGRAFIVAKLLLT